MKQFITLVIVVMFALAFSNIHAQQVYTGARQPAGYVNPSHHQSPGTPNNSLPGALNPSVSICGPCAIPEGEPDIQNDQFDVTNGGCNQLLNTPPSPPIWLNINMGDVYCGRCNGYYVQTEPFRDTDWYKFVLAAPGTVYWSALTTFDAQIMLISENCSPQTMYSFAFVTSGIPGTTSWALPAGTYYAFISPQGFGSAPQYTGQYMVKLSLVPNGPPETWCGVIPRIPTLGQWGLIFLGITLLAFGTVYIVKRG